MGTTCRGGSVRAKPLPGSSPHRAGLCDLLHGQQRGRGLAVLAEDDALGGDEVRLAVLQVVRGCHVLLHPAAASAAGLARQRLGQAQSARLDGLGVCSLGHHEEEPGAQRQVVRVWEHVCVDERPLRPASPAAAGALMRLAGAQPAAAGVACARRACLQTHRACGVSASMTFSVGPRPSFRTASWRCSTASAAEEALLYLT